MEHQRSLRFLVDSFSTPDLRETLPPSDFGIPARTAVDVALDALKSSLRPTIAKVLDLFADTPSESGPFEVTSISFQLSVEATGEVSIVSIAKGSLTGHTGIEVTVARRPQ